MRAGRGLPWPRRATGVISSRTVIVPAGAPYRPGEFCLRELPPLRAVIPAAGDLAVIVADGYVDLDPAARPGLGARVFAEFGVPVIGVAETAFRTATHAAEVFRGQSSRPLCVTAAGMTVADAAGLVSGMAGQFRVPDALKRADRLAGGPEPPDAVPAGWFPQSPRSGGGGGGFISPAPPAAAP